MKIYFNKKNSTSLRRFADFVPALIWTFSLDLCPDTHEQQRDLFSWQKVRGLLAGYIVPAGFLAYSFFYIGFDFFEGRADAILKKPGSDGRRHRKSWHHPAPITANCFPLTSRI